MHLRADAGLVEPLGRLFFLGRSSAHRVERARVLRRAELQAALSAARGRSPAARARRGRLLRLLGRLEEARAELDAAAGSGRADALAWRWELSAAGGPERPEDLAAALSLEPGQPVWLAWEAARLAAASRSEQAVERARRAATLAPEWSLPLLLEGLALLEAGRHEPAERAFGAALALEPGVEWAYRARARARLALGDRDGCLADCFEAMRRGEMIGTLCIPLGLADRAVSARENVEAASRELERDPRASWALVYRADYRRDPSLNENAAALADLRRAVELEPGRAWAWAYLARAQAADGELRGARESLERAASLDPECGWIRAWRGEHERRAGRPREALAELERALAADPDYELAYAWRGGALRALGRPAASLRDMDVAIALDPTYVEWCHFERMAALRDLDRVGDALEALQAAHALNAKFVWENDPRRFASALKALSRVPARDPRRGLALAWKGELRLRMRDFPAAERELDRAVAAAPRLAFARLLRGRARGERGRWRLALADFDAAVRLSGGEGEALAWRGRARLKAGRVEAAREDLRAALGSRAGQAAAWIHCWRAEAELAAGRAAEAEAAAGAALELHPRYAEARLWRGLARAARGALAPALEDLRAASAGELSEESRARLLPALSEAERREAADPAARAARLQAEGRHAEAAELYGRALEGRPGDAALLGARAEAWRCLGLYGRMVADLEAVCALRPRDAGARASLGDARRHALDFQGALRDAWAAAALEPGSAHARVLEAESLRSLGRFEEAAAAARAAAAAAPDWPWARVVLGKVLRFAGELDAAERALGADAEAGDPYARGWRAEIRRKAGRREEALEDAGAAVEARPTIAWFRAVRGETLRELGRADEGWAELEAAVRLDGHCSCAFDFLGAELPAARSDASLAWVYAWRGGVARKEGRLEPARADLERAAALAPGAGWALAWLGELELHEGNAPRALARLDEALAAHPSLRPARVWRGRALFALGRDEEALADFQAALKADANDAWALLGLAACHERAGRARRARELLRRARALAPGLFPEPA